MLRVGLSGGIASGKSTVTADLRARGYPVLDADEVYHELLRTDAGMRDEIRTAFGDGIFLADGSLDRKALGAKVFADPAARERLNAIAHPRVRRRITEWMREQGEKTRRPPAAVCVVPLLFENGLEAMFDTTVLVSCPPEEQVRRLVATRGLSEAEARTRLASQMPLAAKRARARHELVNDGAPAEVPARVERLLAALGLPPRA